MNASLIQDQYEVVIVGLGPTGLTLAHLLGLRGLRVLALEREPQFYGNARAVYTDDECMRVFQAAGVAAELEADMLVDTPVQWVLEDGSVLSQLRRMDKPYGWAVSNFFYQPYLETKMEKLLERYPNVTALRGREVVGFSQDDTGVTVEHAASSGPCATAKRAPMSKRSRRRQLVRGRNGLSPATAAAAVCAPASGSRWPARASPSRGSSSTSRRRRARTASATCPISTSIAIRSSRPSPARSQTATTASSSC